VYHSVVFFGPLLFQIYINDVSELFCHNVKVKLFADDIKLYAAVDCGLDFEILQSSLLLLAGWADNWQLSFESKAHKTCNIPRLKNNNQIYTKPEDVCNELNSYFSTIGENLVNELMKK
jgi:hypothetical protein